MVRTAARILIAVLVAGGCVGLALLAKGASDAPAASDTAVIESYTRLASQGKLLLGAYSRFQWHHPGPLYFYLLAPFYILAGGRTAGLNAGAAALSLGSIALIVTVLARRRPIIAATAGAALALYAWRAPEAMASPWNPHVPVLPLAALTIATADVLAGSAAMLPVVALLASVAAQAHVALAPCAVLLGLVAFLRACVGLASGTARDRWQRSMMWTAGTLVLTWALPLYEQVTGTPHGNLTELWSFFIRQPRHSQPLNVAVSAWSDMFVGILRPDFYVAHGWPFKESPVHWAEWLSIGELAAVTVFTLRGARRRQAFDAALGVVLLAVSVVSLWSATRIDELFDHDVFWVAGIGTLALAVALELIVTSAVRSLRSVPAWAPMLVATVCAAVAAVATVAELRAVVRRSVVPSDEARTARAIAGDLRAYMQREHISRPLVKIDQDAWPVAAGAILELQKEGTIVSVEEDWVVMFTPVFRVTGREDAVVTVATPAEHLRLEQQGVPVVSAHQPIYAHAVRRSRP